MTSMQARASELLPPRPTGRTQRRWYAIGYQGAMAELTYMVEDGASAEEVLRYVKDNTVDATTW